MIRNLKAKLNALSTAPSVPQTPPQTICFMRETASPLMDFPGLTTLSEAHIRRLCDVEVAQDWDIRRTLFLDTETTGLRGAGTVAFLIGVGFVQDEGFVVRQLLMRDYPEEPALLEELAQLLPRFDRVVTFNGKSFDIPLLRDRFTMARLRARWRELPQLDLMHPSRRVWRLRLQNCRLSNLEGAVLGMERTEDLPGALVPERYFAYIKTKDWTLLEDVLRHNLQDVRTLALLLVRLAQAHAEPEQECFPEDVFSLGRSLERVKEYDRARRCYQVASVGKLSQRARMQLASSYRKTHEMTEAAAVYQDMVRDGQGGVVPYEALAVLAERYAHDDAQALRYTELAICQASEPSLHGVEALQWASLEKRRTRLARRIVRQCLVKK